MGAGGYKNLLDKWGVKRVNSAPATIPVVAFDLADRCRRSWYGRKAYLLVKVECAMLTMRKKPGSGNLTLPAY